MKFNKILYFLIFSLFIITGCNNNSTPQFIEKTQIKVKKVFEKAKVLDVKTFKNKIYFATSKGLFSLNPKNNKLSLEKKGNFFKLNLSSNRLVALSKNYKAFVLYNGSWIGYPIPTAKDACFYNSNLWLATEFGIKIRGTGNLTYNTKNNKQLKTNSFNCLFVDNKNNILLAGSNLGLYVFQNLDLIRSLYGDYFTVPMGSTNFMIVPGNCPLPHNSINYIAKYKDKYYLATGAGIVILDKNFNIIKTFTGPHKKSTLTSNAKSLKSMNIKGNSPLLNGWTTCVEANKDFLWIGHNKGLDVKFKDKWLHLNFKNSYPIGKVFSISLFSTNEAFVATNNGLYKVKIFTKKEKKK